jgi:hypothetical protein
MKYREVLFRPKLVSSWSIPIAALTLTEAGEVGVIVAPLLPQVDCLGDVRAHGLIYDFLRRLEREPAFERVGHLGSHSFELGPVRELPHVTNGRTWIEANVLPSRQMTPARRSAAYSRRATHGWRFIENAGLQSYVKRSFSPSSCIDLPKISLPSISHYVEGDNEVLLLEPLLDGKAADRAKQIDTIAGRFAQYLWLNSRRSGDVPTFKCAAYAINSGELARAAADLLGERAEVFDVSTAVGTERFTRSVQEIAASVGH